MMAAVWSRQLRKRFDALRSRVTRGRHEESQARPASHAPHSEREPADVGAGRSHRRADRDRNEAEDARFDGVADPDRRVRLMVAVASTDGTGCHARRSRCVTCAPTTASLSVVLPGSLRVGRDPRVAAALADADMRVVEEARRTIAYRARD
jgi:hypothetical protein